MWDQKVKLPAPTFPLHALPAVRRQDSVVLDIYSCVHIHIYIYIYTCIDIGEGQGTYLQTKHATAHSVGKSGKGTQKSYRQRRTMHKTSPERSEQDSKEILQTKRHINI